MSPECKSLLGKSKKNFELALKLKEENNFDAAANRLYYSVFQAVKAYALAIGRMKINDSEKVHATAAAVVRDTDKRYHRTMREACELRIKADYLCERVSESEMDQHFLNNLQTMRDEFEAMAKSA